MPRLSEAQRKAIIAMSNKHWAPKDIGVSPNTLRSLMDFGRSYKTSETACAPPVMLVTRDYHDWPRLHWVYALSALGLAVRTALQEQSK